MPTWSEISNELKEEFNRTKTPPFDTIRRKYIASLYAYTNRNCILYATNWTQPGNDPNTISIVEEDIQGLMEVIHGLQGKALDLILHSPGGSPEAAAAIVSYLRSKFDDIRVIIPHAAMSAASMVACASNGIVMGRHSFIGPIDPQLIITTPLGVMAVPAQAILDQFEMAKEQCKDSQTLGAWVPILNQYGPALLIQSRDALDLSKKYASTWLAQYMFANMSDRENANKIAESIADKLSNHTLFKSHSHHRNRDEAQGIGLRVIELEEDQELQECVLSLYHATTHTFNGTPAVKIIENQYGKAYIRLRQKETQQPPSSSPPTETPE